MRALEAAKGFRMPAVARMAARIERGLGAPERGGGGAIL